MAITRREFVTRLGALAAAMGVSQVDLAKITEALAHGGLPGAWAGGAWTLKPKVVWVHGAECTGCSTSLLSLFEDVRGKAIEGTTTSTLTALDLAVGGAGQSTTNPLGTNVLQASAGHPFGHRTAYNYKGSVYDTDVDFDNAANSTPYIANIADVLIDFIDLQYHETVGNAAGDLAYKFLADQMTGASGGAAPFVMVVEGAVQDKAGNGYWGTQAGYSTGASYVGASTTPWCSIGESETGTAYSGDAAAVLSFDDVVFKIGTKTSCKAIVAIGQCATFGGYPGCVSPTLGAGMTGAQGVYDFFVSKVITSGDLASQAANKVINVPGCPTNPWWFVLSVVAWLVDATAVLASNFTADGPLKILDSSLAIKAGSVDSTRRLKAVYGTPLHGPYCTRYQDFLDNNFASKPGEAGCLQLIGCKGPSTKTLCGPHGWNSQQPHNDASWEEGLAALQGNKGGNCIAGGHPCMACTEKGYPDAFVPFVVR